MTQPAKSKHMLLGLLTFAAVSAPYGCLLLANQQHPTQQTAVLTVSKNQPVERISLVSFVSREQPLHQIKVHRINVVQAH